MSIKVFLTLSLLLNLLGSCTNRPVGKPTDQQGEGTPVIRFSNARMAGEEPGEESVTDHLTLNRDSFLTLHFTLSEPLIASLRVLAPEMTEAELLQNGNFQFTFLVDGEKIYEEQLNRGAGTKKSKTEQLQYVVPLMTPERIDFWGWFLWQKFMRLGGGQDVLDVGRHQLAVTIRPYLRRDTVVTGPLLATGNLAVDVADIPVDPSLVPVQAIAADSGWEVSDAAFDRRRIEALNKKIAQGRFRDINGIVVIKDGALLLEEYFNGATRENLHNPRSVGKTIASSVLGIAIAEGHISDAGKRLGEFYDLRSFDNYHPKKDSVTLRSLLTMSSGFVGNDNDYDNPGNEENMYPTKDWVRFALDLPMEKDRGVGEYFSYFTAGVVVLGDVIHRAVPGGLVDYADEKLFAPLGITDYRWQYTPQKVGNTAGGIQLRAVDFAKYGQLYQNRGNWNGIQILPEAWVKESLSPQIALPRGDGDYGYLFWQKAYEVDGKTYEVAYCSGNGGNKIFVFRDIPLVVVITSSAYGAPDAHPNADKIMTDYILPAVLD